MNSIKYEHTINNSITERLTIDYSFERLHLKQYEYVHMAMHRTF